MRKRVLLLLVVFLLLAVWPPCAQAAEERNVPEFIVESTSAKPGTTIDVSVSVKNNPGVLGAKLTLSYEEGLTLTSAESPDDSAFTALTYTKPGKLVSPCNFVWDGTDLKEGDIKDGVILTLTFQVAKDAVPGKDLDLNISYIPGDIVKHDLSVVSPKMTGGVVRVLGDDSETISITQADIEAGTATFQISNQGACLEGYAIVSEYLENGKFVEAQLKRISIDTGTNPIQFEGMDPSRKYKFFVLNTALTPLCESLELSQNREEGGSAIE